MPRSAQAARDPARRSPSPSDSRNIATLPTPSSSQTAASQSPASSAAWLPPEITVWYLIPRREPRALTARLPLWEISATGPGSSGATESPHIGAREPTATMPLPFGPQTGIPPDAAASRSSRSSSRPPAISPNPAEITTAPPQPRAPASETTAGTPAAGMATTTASTGCGSSVTVGTQERPCTSSRRGLTPHTSPSKPARSRLRSTMSAYEPGRSFAPTTATDRGFRRGARSGVGARLLNA